MIANGLERPTGLADPGDGSGRLLILEQPGRIQVYQNGAILPQPFLDVTDRVGSTGNEQGLLGIALHPKYLSNGYFFVNYTDLNGNTVIARFKVSTDPNRADPASEKDLLHVQQPFPNHNGGSMVFGPDGLLYMGLGDGGSQGDPHQNGQSLNTYLGKILRIDVDHGDPYAIPADNPFAKSGGLAEIWAYGLRNPWRFSFDRQTGDLYIADVGQDLYEEIDFLPAGSKGGVDFGWNFREGLHAYKGSPPPGLKLTDPVYEYSHSVGGCSVTGGYVYHGSLHPELQGTYIYGDYCTGLVWGLKRDSSVAWQNSQLFATGLNISSFGEDHNGELYMLDLRDGGVYRLG
jgi:glucose/arabinose dehydrogenase